MGTLCAGVVTVAVFVIYPQICCSSGLSDKKLCQDNDCKVAISEAEAVSEYDHSIVDSRFLSFPKGASITVFSKSAGVRGDLWSGTYKDKFGFFSKSYVKETVVHHSEPEVIVAIEAENDVADNQYEGGAERDADEAKGGVTGREDGGNDEGDDATAQKAKNEGGGERAVNAKTQDNQSTGNSHADERKSVAPLDPVDTATGDDAEATQTSAAGLGSVLHPSATVDNGHLPITRSEHSIAKEKADSALDRDNSTASEQDLPPSERLPLHPTPVGGSASNSSGAELIDVGEKEKEGAAYESPEKGDQILRTAGFGIGHDDVGERRKEMELDRKVGEQQSNQPDAAKTLPPDLAKSTAESGTVSATTELQSVQDSESTAEGAANETAEGEVNGTAGAAVAVPFNNTSSDDNAEGGSDRYAGAVFDDVDVSTPNSTAPPNDHSAEGTVIATGGDADTPEEAISVLDVAARPTVVEELSRGTPLIQSEQPLNHRMSSHISIDESHHQNATTSDINRTSARQPQQQDIDRSASVEPLGATNERLKSADRDPRPERSSAAAEDSVHAAEVALSDSSLPVAGELASSARSKRLSGRPHAALSVPLDDATPGKLPEKKEEATPGELPEKKEEATPGELPEKKEEATPGELPEKKEEEQAAAAADGADAVPSPGVAAGEPRPSHMDSDKVNASSAPELGEPPQEKEPPDVALPHVREPADLQPPAVTVGEPIGHQQDEEDIASIDYAAILSALGRRPPETYVGLIELQLWRLAASLPAFVQHVMQSRPFGIDPPLFVLANLVTLWLITCSSLVVCCVGCCDSRAKVKSAEARCLELYKQVGVAEVELKEMQAALQQAEQRNAAEAQEKHAASEARVKQLEDQLQALRAQAESEDTKWRSMVSDGEAKLRQTCSELVTSSAYIVQWQAYAREVDEKLKAAMALTPDLEARCSEAERVAEHHRDKCVTLEAAAVRLDEELTLLKQERDYLKAEAADRDEKALELEVRLHQQDVERGSLQAAMAARELEMATLRQAYEGLLLADAGETDESFSAAGTAGEDVAVDNEDGSSCSGGEGMEAAQQHKRSIVEQHLQQVLEAAKVRTHAQALEEENNIFKEKLKLTEASLVELQDISHKHLVEKEHLLSEISVLKRAKDEADMSLKVLTAYFKEKEAELQRTLGEKEHTSKASGANVIELQQQCSQLLMERDQLRHEVKDVRDELQTAEKDMRKQLLDTEKKAHDAWVSLRSKERELAAQQTESSQLRQKLLDAELTRTKLTENLSELRLQLELETAKCHQAVTALTAASAAASASAAVAGGADGAADESSTVAEPPILTSKSAPVQSSQRDRPTSRGSISATGLLPARPFMPPLLPLRHMIPRPLMPPFGMPPRALMPGMLPPMPPPPQMIRDPRDRHSLSPPPISDRPLTRQHMTPPPDAVSAFPPQPMDPRRPPMYGSFSDVREGPPRGLQPLDAVPPDAFMPRPAGLLGPRGVPPPLSPDMRGDAMGVRLPPTDPAHHFAPLEMHHSFPLPRGPRVGPPLIPPGAQLPQRFVPPSTPFDVARTAQLLNASALNRSTISNDGWNVSHPADREGDRLGNRPGSSSGSYYGPSDSGHTSSQQRGGV